MKPTRAPAEQPQSQPASDPPTQPSPARATVRDAFPFATDDVLFAFGFLRSTREDR